MTSSRILSSLTLCFLILIPSLALAHGEAVLCDNREELVAQCGEDHACVTDPAVSEFIGYCKANAENIAFTLCDHAADDPGCASDEVCKIGTIDPHIGVCAQVTSTEDTAHEHAHDESEDEGGCQSAPGSRPSSSLSLFGLAALLGAWRLRRSRP